MMIYERFPKQYQRLEGFTYKQDIVQGLANVPYARPRRSGTTTALAIRTIAIALQHPGSKVVIADHHGSQRADENMADRVEHLIQLMKLLRVTVQTHGPSSPCVVYHPDTEVPK